MDGVGTRLEGREGGREREGARAEVVVVFGLAVAPDRRPVC